MICSNCGYAHSQVVETRQGRDEAIKRRRQCVRCGLRFTTLEHVKPYKHKDLDKKKRLAE